MDPEFTSGGFIILLISIALNFYTGESEGCLLDV